MDDQELEAMLESGLSQLPPEETIVHDVTPWRKAFNRILWGMGLTTMTLNILNLDTILPAIGHILLVLGYRALRRESRWFRWAYFLNCLCTVAVTASTIVNATVWNGEIFSHPGVIALVWLLRLCNLFSILCLWRGLVQVRKNAGLEPRASSSAGVLVMHCVTLVLSLWNTSGLLPLVLLVVYCFLIGGLYRLSRELDDVGYAITPAPGWPGDRVLAGVYSGVLILGVAIGCGFFQSYPMDWAIQEQTETETVRQELLDLGFPEDVLDDLSAEDLTACAGAMDLHLETGHGIFPDELGQDTQSRYQATSIALLLPGNRVRVFFHFRWADNVALHGTQALWMRAENSTDDYTALVAEIADSFSGSVLYRENGVTCRAPFAETEFSGGRCYAGFSFPEGSDRRGYVTFEVTVPEDRLELLGFWFFFSCRNPGFPVLYPSQTALEWETEGGGSLFFDEYVDVTSYFLFVSEGNGFIRDTG